MCSASKKRLRNITSENIRMWIEDIAPESPLRCSRLAPLDASFAATKDYIVAHGGKDKFLPFELASYSFDKHIWSTTKPRTPLLHNTLQGTNAQHVCPRRKGHCAFLKYSSGEVKENVLFVHGGQVDPDKKGIQEASRDLYSYSFSHDRWEKVEDELSGCRPPAMYGHAAVRLSDETFAIAGALSNREKRGRGEDAPRSSHQRFRMAVFTLTATQWKTEWEEVEATGEIPPPLWGFQLELCTAANRLVALGGQSGLHHPSYECWMLDLSVCPKPSGVWTKLLVEGLPPRFLTPELDLMHFMKESFLFDLSRPFPNETDVVPSFCPGEECCMLVINHMQYSFLTLRVSSATLCVRSLRSTQEVVGHGGRFAVLERLEPRQSPHEQLRMAIRHIRAKGVTLPEKYNTDEGEEAPAAVIVFGGLRISSGRIFRITIPFPDAATLIAPSQMENTVAASLLPDEEML